MTPDDRIFTAEISPTVADDGSTSTFLFSSRPWATKPTDTPANTRVRPLLKSAGTVRRELFSGARVTGAIRPSFGNIVLANPAPVMGAAGELDDWAGYGIAGSRIVVRWGRIGDAYPAAWDVVYIAYAQAMVADVSEIVIRLRDRLQVLDQPLVADSFLGTGGLEGNGGVDKRKQFVSGDPGLIPPVLVLVNEQIYFVQSTGDGGLRDDYLVDEDEVPLFGVWDNGMPLTREANYGSMAELLAQKPSPGCVRFWFGEPSRWVPSHRNGSVYMRLGSPPAGDIRVFAFGAPNDADHDRAGRASGSYFAAHLALRAGLKADELDDSGWVSLPVNAQLVDDDRTYLQVLDDAALCVNGWFGMSRLDKFRSGFLLDPESRYAYYGVTPGVIGSPPVMPTTSVYTFRESRLKDFRREPVPGMEAPIWKVTGTAGETWKSNVANGATNAMRDYLTRDVWATMQGVSSSTLLANPGAQTSSVKLRPRTVHNNLSARLYVERHLVLFGGRREFFSVTEQMSPETLALELHDVVTLVHSRYGLAGGRKFRIVRQTIDCQSDVPSIQFLLWGGTPGQYTGGSGGPGSVPPGPGGSGPPAESLLARQSMLGDFSQVFYGAIEIAGGGGGGDGGGDGAEQSSTSIGEFEQVMIGEVAGIDYSVHSVLFINGQGSITAPDQSPFAHTFVVASGTASMSTTGGRWGNGHMQGTSPMFVYSSPNFGAEFSGLTWTWQCWYYREADGDYHGFWFADATGRGASLKGPNNGGAYELAALVGGDPSGAVSTSPAPLNAWTHLAITCEDVGSGIGRTRVFVNGNLEDTHDSATALSPGRVDLGRANTAGFNGLHGKVSDFVLEVGICRWTASFTPPTGPL